MNILIIVEVNFLCSLSGHIHPLNSLIVEPRMITHVIASNAISLKHTSSWCLFMEPHKTTYIGDSIRKLVKLGLPILYHAPHTRASC